MTTEQEMNTEITSAQGMQTPAERAAQLGIQEHTATTLDFVALESADQDGPFPEAGIESGAIIRENTDRSQAEMEARSGYDGGEVNAEAFYTDKELLEAGVEPTAYHKAIEMVVDYQNKLEEAIAKVDGSGASIVERLGSAITNEKHLAGANEVSARVALDHARTYLESARKRVRSLNNQVENFRSETKNAA